MRKLSEICVDIMSYSPEVTGSLIYVSVHYPDNRFERFIVDCGLFQEPLHNELNRELAFDPSKVDFSLITHNHVDHIGRLPFIVKNGYCNPIYTTEDTEVLMPLAFTDAVSIFEQTAKKYFEKPLYSQVDVNKTMELVQGVPFECQIEPTRNIKVTFFKNGHLPGASLILVTISFYGCESENILFTGDFNCYNSFFSVPKLPRWVNQLPLTVVCESTYGYMDSSEVVESFEENVCSFYETHPSGTIILPCFSLGRSQEILKKLKNMQERNLIDGAEIFLDGKLTFKYTSLYEKGKLTSIDEDKSEFLPEGVIFASKDQRVVILKSVSKKIIVSSSGMGSYGPAQSYIQSYIKREDALIHFTGYCAEGTMSRQLYDAADDAIIQLGGLAVRKKATVKFTNEFSSHAKADELLNLLKQFKNLKLVLVTHGQEQSKKKFVERILDEVDCQNVGTLSRNYFFRIIGDNVKTLSTHFH